MTRSIFDRPLRSVAGGPDQVERFRPIPAEHLRPVYENAAALRVLRQEGIDPASLAVFLDRASGALELRVLDYHHRSVDTAMPKPLRIARGRASEVFCTFDIKGIGFLNPDTHVSKKEGLLENYPGRRHPGQEDWTMRRDSLTGYPEVFLFPKSREMEYGYENFGLMDRRVADHATKMADVLSAAGMRVEGFAAVYALDRFFFQGEPIALDAYRAMASRYFDDLALAAEEEANGSPAGSSDRERCEARRRECIEMAYDMRNKFEPVIAIRMMRTPFRIKDYDEASGKDGARMLEEACEAVSAEQDLQSLQARIESLSDDLGPNVGPRVEGPRDLPKFCAWHFGRNLGILQSKGMAFRYMNMGNLNLAGELVDLDSATKILKVGTSGKVAYEPGADQYRRIDPRFRVPGIFLKDFRDLAYSLRRFLMAMDSKGVYRSRGEFDGACGEAALLFSQGYHLGLGAADPFLAAGISNKDLKRLFHDICCLGVLNGDLLRPILPDEKAG